MKVKVRYKKLPYQELFHYSEKPKVILSAGYGAGKTYSLCMKALRLAQINYGLPGGILAPNLKMFKRDVWPTFREISQKSGLKITFNKVDSTIHIPATKTEIFVFHAEDDGESIRGPNLAFGLINEVTLCSEAAFKAFLARIRIKGAKLRQLAMSGTPEGFNWAYDYFISTPRPDTDLFFGDMRLNKYVSDDYAQMLIDSYDDQMIGQFVGGQFNNTNGKAAAYKFNRVVHSKDGIERIPGLPVWVSIDFNVAPMAATFFNKHPEQTGMPVLTGFDEILIKDNADTYELAKEIKERVGTDNVVLFPDPAGNQRKTSSTKTDIQILRDAGFTDIRNHKSIRSVKDQMLALNSFVGKSKIMLDREKCKEAIKDLEQCIMKEGTNELDKSNPKRTHWLDGIKNMVHFEFPIVGTVGGWREVKIR